MKRSILLIFAHPDDESFGLAGTVLKYVDQGVPVDLICATKGEKGTRQGVPEDMDTGIAREDELRTAAAIMGIREIFFLGYIDGELKTADADEVTNRVLEIMREVKPEVVITFGPDGITGHGDHVTIGKTATAAFERLTILNGGPRKLYYVTIPESIISDADEFGVATRPDDEITTAIDIGGYLDRKIGAIAAHKSQKDTVEFIEMLREVKGSAFTRWEFFYLASSKVSVKETNLLQ